MIELSCSRRTRRPSRNVDDSNFEAAVSEIQRERVAHAHLASGSYRAAIDFHRAFITQLFRQGTPFDETRLLQKNVDAQGAQSLISRMARSRSCFTKRSIWPVIFSWKIASATSFRTSSSGLVFASTFSSRRMM